VIFKIYKIHICDFKKMHIKKRNTIRHFKCLVKMGYKLQTSMLTTYEENSYL
jgi:hypothetical protein